MSDNVDTLVELLFQSTRPVQGATGYFFDHTATAHVSIHAPRTGRDDRNTGYRG